MCKITDKIEGIVKKDKNGQVLLLITKLIDDRFNALSKDQNLTNKTLNEINNKISCVNENAKDISKLKKDMNTLEVVAFFSKHPQLARVVLILLILAVILAYTTGIDTLFKLI